MKVVNLTSHEIVLVGQGEEIVVPPSGQEARLDDEIGLVTHQELLRVNGRSLPLDIYLGRVGEVVGLPPPTDDTLYLVSSRVAAAVRRPDVAAPYPLRRDEENRITGAYGLLFFA